MKLLDQMSIVLISSASAVFFAIYFIFALFGNMRTVGPYPLGISILGAIFMCWLPIGVIRYGGTPKQAAAPALFVLVVSALHVLSLYFDK